MASVFKVFSQLVSSIIVGVVIKFQLSDTDCVTGPRLRTEDLTRVVRQRGSITRAKLPT